METKKKNDYGLVYALSNPRMKGLIKIGYTTKHDLAKRMAELYKTGVPVPFEEVASCRVPTDQLKFVESKLHTTFGGHRVGKHEFFEITHEAVKAAIEMIDMAYNLGDASVEIQTAIEKAVKADDATDTVVSPTEQKEPLTTPTKPSKKPNMDFLKMKLHIGDTLVYIKDPSITCTIVSNKKVDYKDDHGVSLSYVSKLLLGRGVQPALYWKTKDGVKLIDLYNKQVVDEATEQFAATDAAIAAANTEYDQFKAECQ